MTVKLFRVRLQRIFRTLGLLAFVERLRYYYSILAWRKRNKIFIKKNPEFALPPSQLAYDAYDAPKWEIYKFGGEAVAKLIKSVASKYFPNGSVAAVYEWGCGPGRIIRHLPEHFGAGVEVYASDYNEDTIDWCKQNIPSVTFSLNQLNPPLEYTDNKFDLIYCISVFTHLSSATGINWANELFRVLKKNGILILTTHGQHSYQTELLADEKIKYEKEGIVVRDKYKEGKKMFLTMHNPEFVKDTLLKKFEILEYLPAGFPFNKQDYFIARKN